MMPRLHAKPGSYAAAKHSQSQQSSLRDAPLVALRFTLGLCPSLLTLGKMQASLTLSSLTRSLIYAIHKECNHIDGRKVDEGDVQVVHNNLTKKDIAFQRCLRFGVPGRARTDDIQNHNLTL